MTEFRGRFQATHRNGRTMRRTRSARLFLAFTVGILLFTRSTSALAEPPQEGLLAHWSFDECHGKSTAKVSGFGRQGEIFGAPELTEGVRGRSLKLHGARDYVAVPDADDRFVLWDPDQPLPASADCPLLEGVEFLVVKPREPEVDGYNWLHGAAVCWHKGELYASFGHNQGSENTATEVAHGRKSSDGGKTWGAVFAIDDGDTANPAVSHGVLLSHAGKLWAFQGAFYDRMRKVHTRAYVLEEASNRWRLEGVVAEDGFWPMQEPLKMDDGNWIMAGICVDGSTTYPGKPAAVAISRGEDFTKWDIVVIPKPESLDMWGESTVIVDGPQVLNIARWGKPIALAALSKDYGRTWPEIRESNLPMAGSKPYAGVLSTGQRYLIGTTTADAGNRRSPLTIAVSQPGKKAFSKVYRIRDAVHDGRGESHPNSRLSYPYAVEHDGKLYVTYSNEGGRGGNRNSAELAIIPIEALRADQES